MSLSCEQTPTQTNGIERASFKGKGYKQVGLIQILSHSFARRLLNALGGDIHTSESGESSVDEGLTTQASATSSIQDLDILSRYRSNEDCGCVLRCAIAPIMHVLVIGVAEPVILLCGFLRCFGDGLNLFACVDVHLNDTRIEMRW